MPNKPLTTGATDAGAGLGTCGVAAAAADEREKIVRYIIAIPLVEVVEVGQDDDLR